MTGSLAEILERFTEHGKYDSALKWAYPYLLLFMAPVIVLHSRRPLGRSSSVAEFNRPGTRVGNPSVGFSLCFLLPFLCEVELSARLSVGQAFVGVLIVPTFPE